jgi:hypothetical protein
MPKKSRDKLVLTRANLAYSDKQKAAKADEKIKALEKENAELKKPK